MKELTKPPTEISADNCIIPLSLEERIKRAKRLRKILENDAVNGLNIPIYQQTSQPSLKEEGNNISPFDDLSTRLQKLQNTFERLQQPPPLLKDLIGGVYPLSLERPTAYLIVLVTGTIMKVEPPKQEGKSPEQIDLELDMYEVRFKQPEIKGGNDFLERIEHNPISTLATYGVLEWRSDRMTEEEFNEKVIPAWKKAQEVKFELIRRAQEMKDRGLVMITSSYQPQSISPKNSSSST